MTGNICICMHGLSGLCHSAFMAKLEEKKRPGIFVWLCCRRLLYRSPFVVVCGVWGAAYSRPSSALFFHKAVQDRKVLVLPGIYFFDAHRLQPQLLSTLEEQVGPRSKLQIRPEGAEDTVQDTSSDKNPLRVTLMLMQKSSQMTLRGHVTEEARTCEAWFQLTFRPQKWNLKAHMWYQLSMFPSFNAAIAMQHHPGNIHQSIATPRLLRYSVVCFNSITQCNWHDIETMAE